MVSRRGSRVLQRLVHFGEFCRTTLTSYADWGDDGGVWGWLVCSRLTGLEFMRMNCYPTQSCVKTWRSFPESYFHAFTYPFVFEFFMHSTYTSASFLSRTCISSSAFVYSVRKYMVLPKGAAGAVNSENEEARFDIKPS